MSPLSKIKLPTWLGPCASLLCLIHCFSLPILVIFIPTLHTMLNPEIAHRFHLGFWVLSALVGYKVLDQINASLWIRVLFAGLAVLTLAFLLVEREHYFHVLLVAMALIQLGATLVKHRSRRLHPTCCEHEHCQEVQTEARET